MSDRVNTNFIDRLLAPKPEFNGNIQGAGAHIAIADESVFNAKERQVDLSGVSTFCAT